MTDDLKRTLNVRRLVLDVDKAVSRPHLINIAAAIHACAGVKACNMKVGEIDLETVGLSVTIEGEGLNYDEIVAAIENAGAVVHSLDELAAGDRLIENVPRGR